MPISIISSSDSTILFQFWSKTPFEEIQEPENEPKERTTTALNWLSDLDVWTDISEFDNTDWNGEQRQLDKDL
jgi:hypothetical protein